MINTSVLSSAEAFSRKSTRFKFVKVTENEIFPSV